MLQLAAPHVMHLDTHTQTAYIRERPHRTTHLIAAKP